MKRTRQDWLTVGLRLLRDGGEGALTIDRLCDQLARSKGSFYHHFVDIAAYHSALLEEWARTHTEAPMANSTARRSVDRRRQLQRAVLALDLSLERAVHAWAVRSPVAAAVAHAVHRRRIAFLATLHPGKNAQRIAERDYAAFIGALHVFADDAAARRRIQSA